MAGADFTQQTDQRLDARQIVRAEQSAARAGGRVLRRVLAGEQALCQRAVRDQRHIQLLAQCEQAGALGVALEQAVFHLIRSQRHAPLRQRRVRAPRLFDVVVGDADRPGQARLHRIGQPVHPGLDGHGREGKVDLVEVHLLHPQPFQAAAQRPEQAALAQAPGHREKLGRDDGRLPVCTDELAQETLRLAKAIHLRRVETGDPGRHAGVEGRLDLPLSVALAVAPHHAVAPLPRTDAERRDAHVGLAELNGFAEICVHDCSG